VKPNRVEQRMEDLLVGAGVLFERQRKWAGHRIDCTLLGPVPPVLVDVNGEWWHAWAKIVDCDRVKLNRVFGTGTCRSGRWMRVWHGLCGAGSRKGCTDERQDGGGGGRSGGGEGGGA
jgi:hypothetical protein